MLSSRYRPWHVPVFLAKYAWLRARRRPVLLNLEVTMRCNARCGFCDYWKTPADARHQEVADYAAIVRHFSPMLATFTGGEPTLRRDLEDIVRAVRQASRFTYLQLITHGGMLTVERAKALWDAGLQLTMFVEHDSVPWNALGDAMVGDEAGEYRLRDHPERLAASYTLRAVKG